jgi:dTDP-4-dehydrorhamnose reductase
LGDGIVQLLSNDYLICRCTHKRYPFEFEKAFVDRIGNFDYTHKIAELIISLIKAGESGVYNVGTEVKSIYDLVHKDFPEVKPANMPDGYPKNTSFSIDKLNKFLNKCKK